MKGRIGDKCGTGPCRVRTRPPDRLPHRKDPRCHPHTRRVRGVARGWAPPSAAAVLVAALPTAAQAADQLALTDRTEPLGPGITLRHLKTLSASGWLDEQVLTADLANPAVSSDLLSSGKVAKGSPISEQANAAGAIAGVNGDFFDIDNSQAPLGVMVQNGTLLKSQQAGAWNAVGVGQDGIGRLIDTTLQASSTVHGVDYPLATVNAAGGAPAGAMIAYTSAWGSYSRAIGIGTSTNVAEATIADGKVVSINSDRRRLRRHPGRRLRARRARQVGRRDPHASSPATTRRCPMG